MSRYRPGIVIVSLCVAYSAVVSAAELTLIPADVPQHFTAPDRPAVLHWKMDSGRSVEPMEYTLQDYTGRPIGPSQMSAVAEGMVAVKLRPFQGYLDVQFTRTKQRFGVVSLAAFQGDRDPFFAIDGALSWLVGDDRSREGLVAVAGRSGISMVRERLTWGSVHSAPSHWDWEGRARFDSLRKTYEKYGLAVLEMAHDSPGWLGQVGRYPENLVGAAESWTSIARRWQPRWGAMEVWNEPDISFGDNLPADQYVPLARAISYGLWRERIKTPVVGGVMAYCNQEFLKTAAANGLLECIDAFSFHNYGEAMGMEAFIERYRTWLEQSGAGSMPLWITECGRPWKKGPDRPAAEQDAASALEITMKAVESRACGIARYFPFVYPYYDEGPNNFGMMDKRGTPLRSMAAYAQLIRVLAGLQYQGDLNRKPAEILRPRVWKGQRVDHRFVYRPSQGGRGNQARLAPAAGRGNRRPGHPSQSGWLAADCRRSRLRLGQPRHAAPPGTNPCGETAGGIASQDSRDS